MRVSKISMGSLFAGLKKFNMKRITTMLNVSSGHIAIIHKTFDLPTF